MNNPIIDRLNVIGGIIVSVLTFVLGDYWMLFVSFLILNIIDYITGCIKSRINGKTNSAKGLKGVLKKLGYWLMILVAFGMSAVFIEIGKVINVDLGVTSFIGWFVLATLIINEFRSIIENFVEAGYNVPPVLIKGLEVANKAIDGFAHVDENGKIEVSIPSSDIKDKNNITLQIVKK